MPNVYVIRGEFDDWNYGYVTNQEDVYAVDKKRARCFSSLLEADSYAAALDMDGKWTHTVEVL